MPKKETAYKVICSVEQADGSIVPLDSLTTEQMETLRETWQTRLRENMTRYFSAHPDEFERLPLLQEAAAI